MYGQIDGVHVKRKNHEDVRFCSSDDSVHLTDCGGVLELNHSRICLLLVAVESAQSVHLDLNNCNKALSLGISHINPPGRSKRWVDRLSRPNEHCHLSSLQHWVSLPTTPNVYKGICIENCMRIWEVLHNVIDVQRIEVAAEWAPLRYPFLEALFCLCDSA